MSNSKNVVLLRSGNRLVVSPSSPEIKKILQPLLTYTETRFTHGREYIQRQRNNQPTVEVTNWACYGYDHKDRLATSFGFLEKISKALIECGYQVTHKWAIAEEKETAEQRNATVFNPRWDRVNEYVEETGFKFRYKQIKALKLIAEHENGRIDCPPGWGKGTLIALACLLFPKAKIDITTKSCAIIRQRLFPELSQILPSVGIVAGGKKIKGKRVMVYSSASLHHARMDADILLVDEGHQACSDDFAARLAMYNQARIWMFSGSWDMRLDKKDMRAEALAGPIRLVVSYKEAERHGMVVPIEVIWTDVLSDFNPCDGQKSIVSKKKSGFWTHTYRNELIAADANLYDDDTQVLITVETLEHAMNLKTLLPNFTVVYSGQGLSQDEIDMNMSLYPDTFEPMPAARRDQITKAFETGELKKVIATTVWNVGVNFLHLEVLIRGDGGGSAGNDTQIPGRNSRPNQEIKKQDGSKRKLVAIIHDYRDQFDFGCNRKAKGREANYAKNEWRQHSPITLKQKKKLIKRLMNGEPHE